MGNGYKILLLAFAALLLLGTQGERITNRVVLSGQGAGLVSTEFGDATASTAAVEGYAVEAQLLEPASIVAVTRPDFDNRWGGSSRLEILYDSRPSLGDLQSTLLHAADMDYPILWAENANVDSTASGWRAVIWCSWPADAPHWIVAEQGALTVCGQYGEPSGPSPCTPPPVAEAFYIARPLNAADVGSFAIIFASGQAIEIRAASDSTLLAVEYVGTGDLPEVWTRYLPAAFRDCATDSLIALFTPQAKLATEEGCQ